MQTFLPYPDLRQSAEVLDDQRLGNQRRECLTIISRVTDFSQVPAGWAAHPAVRMWRGYHDALELYLHFIVEEWVRRGFENTVEVSVPESPTMPWWLGDDRLHSSHRAALLSKNPGWYRQFGWKERPIVSYWWPL